MAHIYVDADEALSAPFYAFGLLLIGHPLLDFVTSVLPVSPTNIQWRFATVGLLSNFLMTPMLGLGIMIVVAAVREHLVFQRVLAIVNTVAALVLIAFVALFVLDIVQLNASIQPEGLKEFQSAAFKAVLKHISAIIVLCLFAAAGWRVSSWKSASRALRS
ncbi:MAG: hypothetical protein MNPFHGCM_01862 [Gemmatimonadaceae bacterium]|nr:hypothetical protein [Gemmatimonadaceae bacterium]